MSSLVLPRGVRASELPLTEREIAVLKDPTFIALLSRARLTLACPRCLASGRTLDAVVEGQNGVGDSTWSVDCQCTARTFHRGLGH